MNRTEIDGDRIKAELYGGSGSINAQPPRVAITGTGEVVKRAARLSKTFSTTIYAPTMTAPRLSPLGNGVVIQMVTAHSTTPRI